MNEKKKITIRKSLESFMKIKILLIQTTGNETNIIPMREMILNVEPDNSKIK